MEAADLSGGQYSVNEKTDTQKEDQAFVTRMMHVLLWKGQ